MINKCVECNVEYLQKQINSRFCSSTCNRKCYVRNNKEKISSIDKKHYAKRRQDKIESNSAYYFKNKDKIREYKSKYRFKNKQKIKEQHNKWRSNNSNKLNYKNKAKESSAKYRATKLNATPKWLTKEQLQDIIDIYTSCPSGYHVDHIVPLQGKIVRGLHVSWNLRVITKEENLIKSNKLIKEII